MNRSRTLAVLPLLGGILLAACQDGEITAPFAEDTEFAAEDVIALDLLASSTSLDAALAVADGPVAAATRRRGFGHAGAQDDVARARVRYQEAVRLREHRDSAGAAAEAREARRLVVRAGQVAAGALFAAGMVERLEELAQRVAQNPGGYDDPVGLQQELNDLAAQARQRLQVRDSTGAGERGVLGEQRHRQRQRDGGLGAGADVHVALGAEAVALATRLLDEQGADEEQLRYLDTATEYQRAAEAALAAGDLERAIHFADLAQWTALKAVVLPGGVTDEEVRMVADLAEALYAEAVASGPTDVEALLLARARALIDHGLALLEAGSTRGVGALWRAAVISSWIAG